MITISLCMIVKNEETTLSNCLNSVKDLVDEIIIIDTGSSDKTVEVAKKFTQNVHFFNWVNDFSAARNYAFSKASKDYIFWLDADDILKECDRIKFMDLKQTDLPNYDAISMRYHYAFNDTGEPILTFRRNRIVKREKGFKWFGFIHEYLEVNGKILDSDINISHMRIHGNSDRNLIIFTQKLQEGYKLNSRETYYYGKELFYHELFDECVEVLEKVLIMDGWYEEKIQALITLADISLSKELFVECRNYCYKTFEYDSPRGETLYRLALSFQQEGKYSEAISWYKVIIHLNIPKDNLGFIYNDYWTWLPHLQLCVCYYKLGDLKYSFYHNNIAYNINPTNESILKNIEFFKSISFNPIDIM